jgi:hypothetical protein
VKSFGIAAGLKLYTGKAVVEWADNDPASSDGNGRSYVGHGRLVKQRLAVNRREVMTSSGVRYQ